MVDSEHFDVVVVGAGISGIGAGHHLQKQCPDRRYVILEGRADLGGTWDLFRYPGIRSDSDMHTLGFSFKPWVADKAIADGPSILSYLRDTAEEFGIDRHIRYSHLVTRAEWDSAESTWTLTVDHPEGRTVFTCSFLFMCSGYYSYKSGHTPVFADRDSFQGQIIHPQDWPTELDHQGKRIVVIGSGATAMTLIPALAEDAAHVTMLQRSPTYVVARPDKDWIANRLRWILPDKVAYRITRWKNVAFQQFMYRKVRADPDGARKRLVDMVRKELGDDYDVEKHFNPTYDPWDQRICLIPNGDLFEVIKSGAASVVTDHIEKFTETGILLKSGEELEADIIVTATGLELVTVGDMDFVIDGEPLDFAKTWTYKGLAYSDVPNMVSSFGYINASWTLRADLTCGFVCRLLNHMNDTGTTQCTPRLRDEDLSMPQRDMIANFTSGYMKRAMPMLPKQGDRAPWTNPQQFAADKKMLAKDPIDDGVMCFTSPENTSANVGSD